VTITEQPARGRPARTTAAQRAAEAEAAGGSHYAGLVSRTLAFCFDVLVINCVAWTTGIIVSVGLSPFPIPDEVDTVLIAIGAVIGVLWAAGYFVVFWSANGQTPGDRLLEIAVRDARSGLPLRPRRALLRLLALPLSAIPLCAGFVLIVFDRRRRALHDRLVGTVVVYATGLEHFDDEGSKL
jgi:uncharacterized RDD family membrane protein YckC